MEDTEALNVERLHGKCNEVIAAQMSRIEEQQIAIQNMSEQITGLQSKIRDLESELRTIKRRDVKNLKQALKRKSGTLGRAKNNTDSLQQEIKRLKEDFQLPGQETNGDSFLNEIISRRNAPKNQKYSSEMKNTCFNAQYISPKGYRFFRKKFGNLLPSKQSIHNWIKHIPIEPGLLEVAFDYIKRQCAERKLYYSLSFDEMAIRQEVLSKNGGSILGNIDCGGLDEDEGSDSLAKNAFVCLATEINGSKSFPIAYILTKGIKTNVFAEVCKQCVDKIEQLGGRVITVSFDGYKSNFAAMKALGAKLKIDDAEFAPYFRSSGGTTVYVFPDPSHMVKLLRNTLGAKKVLYNSEGQEINWNFISRLEQLQESEQLRAGNKLTGQHVNYKDKKMNVRLSVQVLSESTATSLELCRKLGKKDFTDSSATSEFLRMANYAYDVLNSRPKGDGCKSPLRMNSQDVWGPLITSSIDYFKGLKILRKGELIPLYKTENGTCVNGIVVALSSLQEIMNEIAKGQIQLGYLPTYRLGQDLLEILFGIIRRRHGLNDNPNVVQFEHSLRAILCFKLSMPAKGNCLPQEDIINPVGIPKISQPSSTSYPTPCQEDEEFEFVHQDLSDFVENIVVYIAGFIGKNLAKTLHCSDCVSSLREVDIESTKMREDFTFLWTKDKGGLFKPSADLIMVCKAAERAIRHEQTKGIFKMTGIKVAALVKKALSGRVLFDTTHPSVSQCEATIIAQNCHKAALILAIVKAYCKTRFNHLAKRSTRNLKPISNRNKRKKITQWEGA